MLVFQETHINRSEGHGIGSDEIPLEATVFDGLPTMGAFYKELVRLGEYGRCTGRVYVDTDTGAEQIGYVFEKRDRYTDTGEPYLRESWLTIAEKVETPTQYLPPKF